MAEFEHWLIKAEHDLKSAIRLAEGDDPILDTAIYHTQQCAEKALKAFLMHQKATVEKVHDLRLLIEHCVRYDKEFEDLRERAEALTPYATIFRYPDELIVPEKEDVLLAIMSAREILAFVKRKSGL